MNSDDDVSLDDVDLFDDSTVSRTEERPQNVKTSGKTMDSQKQPQTTQNNSDIDYMSLNDISIFDSESEAYVSIQKCRRNPHGVVEQSIGTIPLTKKERDEIAKEERRRMNQKLEAQNERYQIIRSTQRIIPIEDIYSGIVVTKDHRYIKIMEFRLSTLPIWTRKLKTVLFRFSIKRSKQLLQYSVQNLFS